MIAAPDPRAGWTTEVRHLLALATPMVAGLVVSALMGVVDTAMLGHLGALPLAAVSLTMSVWVIFVAGLYGFLMPVGILAGTAHGGGDPAAIAATVREGRALALRAGTLAGLVMALILPLLPYLGQPPEVVAAITPYWLAICAMLPGFGVSLVYKQTLEAIDRPWLAVALAFTAVVFNATLNYVLIYGHFGVPALGLAGAGIGTALAIWFTVALQMLVCHRTPSLRARFGGVAADPTLRARLRHEGQPMGWQYVLEGGSVAVVGVFIGWLGATALAANQVVMAVAGVLYMVPLGMAAATSIRIAQAIGGDERTRLRAIGIAGLTTVTAWLVVATVLLTVFAQPIARAFIDDPAVIGLAAALFFTVGLMQVFDGVQSVSLGALRGMLDSHWPTRVSLLAYWGLAVPLAWLCGIALGLGLVGVWAGFGIGLAVAGAMLLRRFLAMTAAKRTDEPENAAS
jgi:MATE family multidrug resistance protein